MISPSIRTLFISSASSTFVKKIICIGLLLSLQTINSINAAIIQPSHPSDDSTVRVKAVDNVNNVATLGKYSRELTNQSTLVRKFDDIDLIPSLARTFMKPLKVYMNPVMRKFIKAYSTMQWWEPEMSFGSCMIEQRYHVNPTEMARNTMLNIIQTIFNQIREFFSMVSFESVKEEQPPIDFSYYERYPDVNQLVVHAAQAAVEHQIDTQVPTRPPPIKFIPPRLRPSFGGLLDRRRRRQGRIITTVRENKEQLQRDDNYDKADLNIFANSEISGLPPYKRVKRYRRQAHSNQRVVKIPSPPNRRQYFYPKPNMNPIINGGVNPGNLNQAMVSPSSSHVNQYIPSQYTVPYTQQQQLNQHQQQHLTYQDFHLPEDQPVDSYKGTLDAENLIDARPISADLQKTYTNWVDDFESLILSKIGLSERTNPKSTGFVACAQTYTWTLMMRFVENMVSKILF